MLRHKHNQLELIIDDNKRIRAFLDEQLIIEQLTEFFGKPITVTGIANYNPSGTITSFEISAYKAADTNEPWFTQLPKPIFEETNLQRIIETQNYKGYKPQKVKKLIEELKVEESLEELLAALK